MKSKEFREQIANKFIKVLEEKPLEWKKSWFQATAERNGITLKPYRGLNVLSLGSARLNRGFEDPRWLTFKQATDAGYKIKKGAKAEQIEYSIPYDFIEHKYLTWQELKEILEIEPEFKYTLKHKMFSVFNASEIEGITPYEEWIESYKNDVKASDFVNNIANGLGIEINYGSDRAFYSPATDKITLPEKEFFDDDNAYIATALHELAHSTLATHRLDRHLDYEQEELVAEITSSFLLQEINVEPISLDNHLAYVQAWASQIKDNKKYLFDVIKMAEKASDYMIEQKNIYLKNELEPVEVNEPQKKKQIKHKDLEDDFEL